MKILKKILFVLFVSLISATISISATFVLLRLWVPRIYTVNNVKVRQEYKGTTEAKARLVELAKTGNARLAEVRKPLDECSKQIKEIRAKMAKAKTLEERKEIENKELKPCLKEFMTQRDFLTKFTKGLRQKHAEASRDENAKITKQISEVVQTIGKERKATYVFDSTGMFYGNLTRDISAEVIKRLNSTLDEKNSKKESDTQKRIEAPTAESLLKEYEEKNR